jgi:hypothetical protein
MSEIELGMKTSEVLSEIAYERERQIVGEGWVPHHDDYHIMGELAGAAACYCLTSNGVMRKEGPTWVDPSVYWPWEPESFKPGDRRRDLIKAAALIVAEIERLDRAEAREQAAKDQPA